MKIVLLALLLAIGIVQCIPGDGIEGCDGHESRFTLSEQLPQLVASVPNGKKYTYDYDGRKFYVVSVKGTAFEMG